MTHPALLISILLLTTLAPFGRDDPARLSPSFIASSPTDRLAWGLLWGARFFEAAQAPSAAGSMYLAASSYAPLIADALAIQAAASFLEAPTPWRAGLERVQARGALERDVPRRALAQARAWLSLHGDILKSDRPVELMLRALEEDASADACALLALKLDPAPYPTPYAKLKSALPKPARARLDALAFAMHAHCSPDSASSWLDERAGSPPASARLARAGLLYGKVHYTWTLNELARIDTKKLTATQRCEHTFRQARATYRIRKLRKHSDALYEKVYEKCTSPQAATLRLKSLYAVAKRAFERGKAAQARELFTLILKDYPERSHADDAMLYLARIARDAGDTTTERALVLQALSSYPQGDMVHELAWESLEDDLRAARYTSYITRLGALPLPDHDDTYFSQGRLTYFLGYAHQQLKDKDAATQAYLRVWRAYPFSFYGYMSWLAARSLGAEDADLTLARERAEDAAWLFDEAWRRSPAALLASTGLYELAAHVASADKSPRGERAQWRLAWLHHAAGHFPLSHNIARRRIPHTPWMQPVQGRTVRWGLNWPAPFGALVRESVAAELAQHTGEDATYSLALPMAIMREESSFIPDIESYAGALGLMQLMPATALDHDADISGEATPERLTQPEVNVRVAADHLFTLAVRLKSHPVIMAAAYNAGAGAARKWMRSPRDRHIALWVEDIPYFQTRNYTKRVIGSYMAYQWLLGVDEFDGAAFEDAHKP